MEIERLLRLDEEALMLEENVSLVRSLSMSRNMALGMMEEVPHMIKLAHPSDEQDLSSYRIPTSSSTSSFGRLIRGTKNQEIREQSESIYQDSRSSGGTIVQISQALSLAVMEDEDMIRTMGMEGFSVIESGSGPLTQISFPSIRGVKKNELLTGITCSRWDNIVGPQCVYLWTEEMTSVFYPTDLSPQLSGVVKYVTDHTVDHQDVDGNSLGPSSQRTTLCIVPELSLVYISISIRVPSEMDTILEFASSSSMTANDPDQPATSIPHAIAILADLKFLSHFLLLRPLIVNWLNEFAPKIGVLVCKNKLQSSMVNSWCAELCKTMTALKSCWVQEVSIIPGPSDNKPKTSAVPTNGHKNSKSHQVHKNAFNTNETKSNQSPPDMEFLPPNLRHVPKSSWSCLLTSHLSTFGSSIIVGFDNLAVNQVIRFLLCFSSNQEGYCSRYSLASLPDTFMKGLYIQGLTLGGIGERSISYNQIVSNKLPLTYVELGSKFKVKQMNPQSHRQLKANVLMQELRALWTSSAFISPTDDPYPQLVKESASFVTQFLDDLAMLPSELRYGRLLLFRRFIHSKAITLVTYLHSIRTLPRTDRVKIIRIIPAILNYDEQEFCIIQVAAEKLKPGVLKLLYI